MSTATIERPLSDAELAASIAEVNGEIAKAKADLESVESEAANEAGRLGGLRAQYGEACKKLARGEDADVIALQDKMAPVEARIAGLKAAIAEKQNLLRPLLAERDQLRQEQFNRKRVQQVAEERSRIDAEIEVGFSAIRARDAAQEQINHVIFSLRNRTCMSPANTSAAKTGAFTVERRSHGIIT
jgi:chromosome segregation ATPase